MHRFFAPDIETTLTLPEEESQHAVRVLRLKEGDEVEVVDGKGTLFLCRISLAHNKKCGVEIVEKQELVPHWGKKTFGSLQLADMMVMEFMGHELSECEIELVGLCTDICVVSNALILKARLPEVKISVDSSCCAGVTPESPREYLFFSNDHNAGFLLYQSFRLLPGGNLTAGIDYKNWGGHAWNDSINGRQAEIVQKSVHEVAGYVVMQQELFEKLSLNAGVRYEHNSVFGGEYNSE